MTRPAAVGFLDNLTSLRSVQKPSRGTAAYGRLVNRPAGRVVAAAAQPWGLTPDGATLVSATLSMAGLLVLGLGGTSLLTGVAVAVLLAGGYVMDSVDGQLARLRGHGSLRGEWLDHTVDCVKTSSLHLVVAVHLFRHPPVHERAVLLVPLGFAVVAAVTYFGLIMLPYLRRQGGRVAPIATGHEHPLRKWMILPTDYGFLCWVFVLLAWPTAFLSVYAVLFALSAAMLGLALRKWWRELEAIDREGR